MAGFEVKHDAEAIFLLGDLFDFWFEYKYVIPKGFTRVLGKLAELSDQGIKIHFFVGNHDLWMNGYFEEELGITVHHQPQEFMFNSTSFFIGHGDGLGPDDKGFKRLKKVFTNSFFKWLYTDGYTPILVFDLPNTFPLKTKLFQAMKTSNFLEMTRNGWSNIAKKN